MSKAFTKESDDQSGDLPDRPISPYRNLVTPAGLKFIEQAVSRLGREHAQARERSDTASLARIERDLRYWNARLATAEVMPAPSDASEVRFGSTVTVQYPDGSHRTWCIVGQDEADPACGRLSYVSPVARALLGGGVGDIIEAGAGEVEIVEIR